MVAEAALGSLSLQGLLLLVFENNRGVSGVALLLMAKLSWPVLGTALFLDILAFALACGALAKRSTVSSLSLLFTSLFRRLLCLVFFALRSVAFGAYTFSCVESDLDTCKCDLLWAHGYLLTGTLVLSLGLIVEEGFERKVSRWNFTSHILLPVSG